MVGCLSSIVGAIALSAITTGYHWLFFRGTLDSSTYGIIWVLTIPEGAALGASTVHVLTEFKKRPGAAGVVGIIGAGAAAIPFSLYLFMATANSGVTGIIPIVAFFECVLFFLPTLLWMAVLLYWSLRLLGKKFS